MDEIAKVISIIGKDIPLARIFLVQGFSCFRAELSIQITFLNAETRSESHQRRAEQTTNKSGDQDDQQVATNDADHSHEAEVSCGSLNPQYDSPISSRLVFMRVGNIASTVRH